MSKTMHDISEYSKKLLPDIVTAVNGAEIPTDDRTRIAGALFDIVHEHHQAVLVLIGNSLYGSAGALLRSIFESYVRGIWFMNCANASDISRFMQDKFKKETLKDRLKEIANVEGAAHGVSRRV